MALSVSNRGGTGASLRISTLYVEIQGRVDPLPKWADTAATLPSNPSPLSEAGGRVLQFCRLFGCFDP